MNSQTELPITSDTPTSVENSEENKNSGDVRALSISVSELIDHVSSKAAQVVDQKNQERFQKQTHILTIVLSAIAVVGIGGIAAFFQPVIKMNVEDSVRDATQILREDYEKEIAYQQFVILAYSISQEQTGFSNTDRDAAMDLLRQISSSRTITRRPGFANFLEKVVDGFFSANLSDKINDIDELFHETMTAHSGIVNTLISHYGQEVVGSPYPISELASRDIERFKSYADAARHNNLSVLASLWELLVNFKANLGKKNGVTDEFLRDVGLLDENDKKIFAMQLYRYAEPTRWQRRTTGQATRIADLVLGLLQQYPQQLSVLYEEGKRLDREQ